MNYTVIADPIRGWRIDNNGSKIGLNRKPKSGMARVKKYRKMLKQHKINFKEVFIRSGYQSRSLFCQHFPDLNLSQYHPEQDLYIFILSTNQGELKR